MGLAGFLLLQMAVVVLPSRPFGSPMFDWCREGLTPARSTSRSFARRHRAWNDAGTAAHMSSVMFGVAMKAEAFARLALLTIWHRSPLSIQHSSPRAIL